MEAESCFHWKSVNESIKEKIDQSHKVKEKAGIEHSEVTKRQKSGKLPMASTTAVAACSNGKNKNKNNSMMPECTSHSFAPTMVWGSTQ